MIAAGLLVLQGCTSLTVHAGDGSITVERHFGLLNVRPQPGTRPMVLHSQALGWQSGPLGHTLGFSTTRLTLLPAACHLVLVDGAGSTWPQDVVQGLTLDGICRADDNPPGEK